MRRVDHRALAATRHGAQLEGGDGGLLERGLLATAQCDVGRVGPQDDVDALRPLLQLWRPGLPPDHVLGVAGGQVHAGEERVSRYRNLNGTAGSVKAEQSAQKRYS